MPRLPGRFADRLSYTTTIAVTLAVFPAVLYALRGGHVDARAEDGLVLAACGGGGPTGAPDSTPSKSITVTLRNTSDAGGPRAHVFSDLESRGPSNGLNPGEFRPTIVSVRPGESETFHAQNDLGLNLQINCPAISRAKYDNPTNIEVHFRNGTLACFGWD